MGGLTLGDKEVQNSIAEFVKEARMCAQIRRGHGVLGLAAMSTIFSCVLAVGEALCKERTKDKILVRRFYSEMIDDRSWLLPPAGVTHDPDTTCEVITKIRNALAHALALPDDVKLCRDRPHAEDEDGDTWRVVVIDFVIAVEETIAEITRQHPELPWQSLLGPGRGPVMLHQAVGLLGESATGTATGSGSYVQITSGHPSTAESIQLEVSGHD